MPQTDAEKHVWEDENGDLVVLLDLPGGPREYLVLDVDAETGRWATRLFQKTQAAKRRSDAGEDVEDIDADLHLSDEAEKDLYGKILGSTLDDLESDGVKWKKTQLVGQVAYAWVVRGLEGARAMWEADGDPKPNREQRRAQSRASGSKTRAGGASASTTKPRASTSGTRTRSRA
jgi:hypothetical protein